MRTERLLLACVFPLSLCACSAASDETGEMPWDAGFRPPNGASRDADGFVGGPNAFHSTDPTLSGLVINEVAAAGDPADWFELFNGTSAPVNLATLTFVAGLAEAPAPVNFPEGSVIEPGRYFVQTLDDVFPGFKLGKDEDLAVYDPTGAIIDSVDWADGDAREGGSYSRIPDGAGPFVTTLPPTRGAWNDPGDGPPPPQTDGGGEPPPPPPGNVHVVLNEVFVSSAVTEDWFELLNQGPDALDLEGFTLSDTDDAHVFTFPAGTSLSAGTYRAFYRGEPDSFDFGLGSDDSLTLKDAAGAVLDVLDWAEGDVPAEQSYGRIPNGEGEPETLVTPTPGARNVRDGEPPPPPPPPPPADAGEEPPLVEARVVLNEVLVSSEVTEDWVELVNLGPDAIDIQGFTLSDTDDAHVFTFAPGTRLAAGAHRAFYRGEPESFDFGLGSDDALTLRDADGEVVDVFDWADGDVPDEQSYGSIPDGEGEPETMSTPTPGAVNVAGMEPPPLPPAPRVVVNEIVAASQNLPDFIELYNDGDGTADLSDFIVTDSDPLHVAIFGVGTELAPGEFLVLYADEAFDFGLGADDSVTLFDAEGVIVDTIDWAAGDAPEDLSYGRFPDGSGEFETLTPPTPGERNE